MKKMIMGIALALTLVMPIAAQAQTADSRAQPSDTTPASTDRRAPIASTQPAPADERQDGDQNRSPYGSYYRIQTPWQAQPIKPAWQR